jgi:hypothetical protein
MTLQGLEVGQPLFHDNLTIFPVVRQVRVRTPEWFYGAVSPVALIILDGDAARLTILDDRISHTDLICWLKEQRITV